MAKSTAAETVVTLTKVDAMFDLVLKKLKKNQIKRATAILLEMRRLFAEELARQREELAGQEKGGTL